MSFSAILKPVSDLLHHGSVLPDLTDQHLREIGVSLGPSAPTAASDS
jgi:hypothetical protein